MPIGSTEKGWTEAQLATMTGEKLERRIHNTHVEADTVGEESDFCGSHTSHVLRWVCVGHNTARQGLVLVVPQQNRRVRHLGQAHRSRFVPPVPSLLCTGLVATDHPRELGTHQVLGSLSLWAVVTATGLVPLTTVGSSRGLWWCWWPVLRWWCGPPGGRCPSWR